uniref:Uncharacterized protein n=1 Tax=Anguilla anguilla TaxID=7936 RepID=A0A0E9VCQ5_ANGAN
MSEAYIRHTFSKENIETALVN